MKMTDQQMRDLCARVISVQSVRSFAGACRFIADCADIEFFRVLRVCQPVAITLAGRA